MKTRLNFFVQSITQFEFWPYWLFYLPMFFYGFYLAIKARSLTYFTWVNPGMHASGIVGEDKQNLLNQLPRANQVNSFSFTKIHLDFKISEFEKNCPFTYPMVIKPAKSERGIGVELLSTSEDLLNYLQTKQGDFVVQEYINYPMEFGVLCYKLPHHQFKISSLVEKAFLHVKGDGKQTLFELVQGEKRAQKRVSYLAKKHANNWHKVVPINELLYLEPIGNHNRGTTFLNANNLINTNLESVFNKICSNLIGFEYGRMDIKVPSLVDFYAGKNIKILEINGVASEPAHIYDPQMPLITAYKSVVKHMHIIYQIALANKEKGQANLPFFTFIKLVNTHLSNRKQLSLTV